MTTDPSRARAPAEAGTITMTMAMSMADTPEPEIRYKRYRLVYPSATVVMAFYADGAPLGEV